MIEHGIVTSVDYIDGVPICTVQLMRLNTEDDEVLVSRMHHGMYCVPKVNQKVLIVNLKDQRFITDVIARDRDYTPPELEPGEFGLKFDEGTELTFTEGEDGLDVSLSASGDINIQADGNITINDTNFADFVEQYNTHTHDYEDDDGESTSTKSTQEPN